MSKWQSVVQCNKCKKIYPNGTPKICEKCGEEIAKPDLFSSMFLGEDRVSLVNAQKVVAKRKFFKWVVKEGAEE